MNMEGTVINVDIPFFYNTWLNKPDWNEHECQFKHLFLLFYCVLACFTSFIGSVIVKQDFQSR
jgi:hypothetical protein